MLKIKEKKGLVKIKLKGSGADFVLESAFVIDAISEILLEKGLIKNRNDIVYIAELIKKYNEEDTNIGAAQKIAKIIKEGMEEEAWEQSS